MAKPNAVIAVFDDHQAADLAVKKLADAGFRCRRIN